ncbi:MAG: ATP-binding protein [Bacteroides sp.]|nr:ATP-binding protein [Bacteroides sp.]
MIRQEEISAILDAQADIFRKKENGLTREALPNVPVVPSFATIITGIRRCGKSTLLRQLMSQRYDQALYLNFEDIRLANFDADDFTRLLREIERRGVRVLFFDEIQIIPKWEIFIHQMLNEEYTLFISGSNASLLSKELGTHLTGRHIPMELFPFSYSEFLSFRGLTPGEESLSAYLHDGGIPEYVKHHAEIILNTLIDDILIRDIAIRNSIKDVNSLRALAVYLLSNVGNLVSAGKLTGMFDIKATSTFLDYFSFYQSSYLLEFVPIFSYSLKVQARNPKKVYAMDLGLVNEASANFSDATGHKLENLIFLHLRRQPGSICYYKDKGECDFVVTEKGKVRRAIQVCHRITEQNFTREYNGLLEAMTAFDLTEGIIVTTNQTDRFEEDGKVIRLMPASELLLE